MKLKEKFDIITAHQVLEHVENPTEIYESNFKNLKTRWHFIF